MTTTDREFRTRSESLCMPPGTRVRLLHPKRENMRIGDECVVTKEHDNTITVQRLDDNYISIGLWKARFETVAAALQPGDKVRCVDATSRNCMRIEEGEVYTVARVFGFDSARSRVILEGHPHCRFDAAHFEKVEPEEHASAVRIPVALAVEESTKRVTADVADVLALLDDCADIAEAKRRLRVGWDYMLRNAGLLHEHS